ncbi:hypothetical protein [Alkalimonas mucilaginosa]|uniref:Uncharacterized protein n=1 Tax=Alkalimonas mucilaginosa TaxID=3057676 RepID=A0ABU7JD00_9GAMM|nr:hypothetical protein [Alkalimonas sp. MEB004]MEE2023564.1 hypothetical protein [Alkalimonas sp. MEB004]
MRKELIQTNGKYHGFATMVLTATGCEVMIFAESHDDLHDAFLQFIKGAPLANPLFDIEKIRAATLSKREEVASEVVHLCGSDGGGV